MLTKEKIWIALGLGFVIAFAILMGWVILTVLAVMLSRGML